MAEGTWGDPLLQPVTAHVGHHDTERTRNLFLGSSPLNLGQDQLQTFCLGGPQGNPGWKEAVDVFKLHFRSQLIMWVGGCLRGLMGVFPSSHPVTGAALWSLL